LRRGTGPIGVEALTGGGDAVGLMRSARLGASSRRGTPSGGRPGRSSTVLPMLTWEFQRSSKPPQSSQVSRNTVFYQCPAATIASTARQMVSWPVVTSAGGCSSAGLSCQIMLSCDRWVASVRIWSLRTMFGEPANC